MSEEKNNTVNELKDIAPLLSDIKRSNDFAVPDGYFDKLPEHIRKKCIDTSKTVWQNLIPEFLSKPKEILKLVVVVLLLFIGIFFIIRKQNAVNRKSDVVTFNDSNSSQQHMFIFDEDTDESELTDAIAENYNIELPPMDVLENNTISSEDIIDYILTESEENEDNEF